MIDLVRELHKVREEYHSRQFALSNLCKEKIESHLKILNLTVPVNFKVTVAVCSKLFVVRLYLADTPSSLRTSLTESISVILEGFLGMDYDETISAYYNSESNPVSFLAFRSTDE